MTREEILKNAGIPENSWPDCYLSDDNMIFTPLYKDQILIKTAYENYTDLQKAKMTNADGTHKYIYQPGEIPTYREATQEELAEELKSITSELTN